MRAVKDTPNHLRKVRIVSRSSGPFYDRLEAGRLLGQELRKLTGHNALVLGIPRGGVVIAGEMAEVLKADLDIVLVRKIGCPWNPELAVGAVGEDGKMFVNENIILELNIPREYLEKEKEHQLKIIQHRSEVFRKVHPKTPLKGRTVIITDDGVATGATMQAALWSIRQEEPCKCIVALPVGPEDTLQKLAQDADEMVCLRVPPGLGSIGQFYVHFEQVGDAAVVDILEKNNKKGRALV